MRKPQKAACSFEGILLILVVGFCVFSIQMNLRSHDRIVSIPMELPERVGVVTLYEIIPDYEDTYQFIIDQRRGGGELLASLEIEPSQQMSGAMHCSPANSWRARILRRAM